MVPNAITRVKQFKTSPEAEAKGQIMAAWLSNQLKDYTQPRLAAKGITEVDFESWYPFQTFLDIMQDIVNSKESVTMILVAIGKAVVENLPLDNFDTMDDLKVFLDGLHSFSVRNMPPYERVMLTEENGEYYVLNNTPVANDIMYGFIWELLRVYTVAGQHYTPIPHQDYPSNEIGSVFYLKPRD